ncbi:MAG TPA: hypothetical protein VH054_14245 [Polyangiaceae bacterium]|jgi:hypothetical protein|nr:hypothetical protein [Polyangiaceae bacterium]
MTGVFCLEGDWYGDHNRSTSVRPLLDLLGQGMARKPDFVHRDVATREELAHYLTRWRRAKRFGLLYLAFHGSPGRLYLGHRQHTRDAVTLDDIAAMVGSGLSGRVVHFGSCSTFAIDRRHIMRFLRQTGITAATGFATDLDWFRASVFEILALSTLLRCRITPRNARRLARDLNADVPSLRRELAFRMVVNERRRRVT